MSVGTTNNSVTVASSALPTGAATSAAQTTGNASLSSIDGKTPALVTGRVPVDGSGVTQPVSAASLPLPTNAATSALQTTGNTSLSSIDTKTPALVTGRVPVDGSGVTQPVSGTVGVSGSVAVTGTFWQATQPVSGSVSVSAIAPPTLTKGTQGATGFSTQDLKDAGRTPVRYYATAAAAGTTGTETAISLTRSSGNSATSAAVSWAPTNGKTFRIQAITFATRGNNTATAQVTTFNFRVNTAGAVATNSTPIELSIRSATPATANAWDRVLVQIPDGWEIAGDGTLQFGVTANAVYVTNAPTWDVTIIGYEY